MVKVNDSPSSGKAAQIEKVILAVLGDVEIKLESRFDRLQIRTDDRVQSRIDKNTAPKFMVERYANQMGEFTFPPILLTSDCIIIDGNTRNKAYATRNDRYIAVMVVQVEWDHADAPTRRKLLFLSELINNMNGLPLSDEEREKMAMTMLEQDAPDEEIVTKVGLSLKVVSELRDKYRAMTRLKSIGIDPEQEDLSDRTLRAFGKTRVMRLDEESYRGVAQLTVDAGLKANEVKAAAAQLNEFKTAEMRRDYLERERQAREPEITARRRGETAINLAAHLRGRLKLLFDHPVSVFVEHNPERIDEYVELIDKSIEVLREIRGLHPQPVTGVSPAAGAEMRQ